MNKHLRYVVLAALLAALVFLFTAYVLHIPIGLGSSGYVHLGDTMVYVAAALLPTPYAMAAAALGGCLADVLSGAAMYAVPTVVIKALMVLPFTAKKEKMLCRRNGLATVFAGMIGVVGYFLVEIILTLLAGSELRVAVGNGMLSVLPNMLQEVAGAVAFVVLAAVLDKADVKRRVLRDF